MLSKYNPIFCCNGQRFPGTSHVYPSKQIMMPLPCKYTKLNALSISALIAYVTPLIDIVRLRQWQVCGRFRFTHHSICFNDLDLQPFTSARRVRHRRRREYSRMFQGPLSSLALNRCTSYPSCRCSCNSLQSQLVCAIYNSRRSQYRWKLWTQRLCMFGGRKSAMEIISTRAR